MGRADGRPGGPLRIRADRAAQLLRGVRPDIAAAGTSLTELFGVGPIVAAIVIGQVGDPRRFPTRDRFAAYNGTAPMSTAKQNGGQPGVVDELVVVLPHRHVEVCVSVIAMPRPEGRCRR